MEKSRITSAFIRIRVRLRGMAAGIVGSPEDAEDVLHEAFCKLWTNHREVADDLSAERLSYTVVRNTAIDAFRRQRVHPQVTITSESVDLPVSEKNAESDRELCDELIKLAKRVLKPLQYEVFILHDVDEIPYAEVAERLDLSETNVRKILSRARKQIRDTYRSMNP